MIGLLIGGVIWGILGDKKGRLSVLFGSILLYSLANIANGMVQTVEQYKIIRFIAGIGLAGELGAGITLVSELIHKSKRGVATSLVAGIGLTGAVVAFFFKQMFDWRTCYYIGGGMGLMLLVLRISVFESSMYHSDKMTNVSKGNIFLFFNNLDRFRRYVMNVLIGLPTWLCIGVLVTFSKEFGEKLGIEGIDPGLSIMTAYAAISVGDVLIGLISQWLQSRKKALYLYLLFTLVFIGLYFIPAVNHSAFSMYWICAGIGFGTGYWAIFVTMAAEQFGTNLRATATTTIPNVVRGMLALFILPLFEWLKGYVTYLQAGLATACIVMALAFIAVYFSDETFGKDLDYVEH
jgi:MFS family permease